MTRRQREARQARERQIVAREGPPRTSFWDRTRARAAAQSTRTRTALRSSSSRALVSMACFLLALPMLPGILTFNYIRDGMILEDRGVRVEAWVVDYREHARGSDTVTVRPVDPPYFETTLDRWLGRPDVGDRVEVVFDPRNPGLAVTVDAPAVDGGVIVIALFDVLGGAFLLVALLPAGELVRRAWARVRGDGAPHSDRILRHRPPLGRRRRVLAGLETGQIVFLLMVAPVVGTVAFGLLAAETTGDAEALRTSGTHARAIVEKSDWDGGSWLDVRFTPADGTETRTTLAAQDHVYYEGDSILVVYEPAAPHNAQAAGDSGWQSEEWVLRSLFIVCASAAVVAVPLALVALVQRSRSVSQTAGGILAPGSR
ncbi:hypothetical protein ACFS27_17640 [Promicromonospora vindobonensis]|uniref:DUF3592 domain-containing protein n=1 Tax=Promicromonospora vindobonensis TaxID=195748 RepID=A0ABW5VUM5_9MICO